MSTTEDCGCSKTVNSPNRSVLARIMGKIFVTEEEKDRRMEICKGCEHFRELTAQCKLCGCFLEAKTRLVGFNCADNPPKW